MIVILCKEFLDTDLLLCLHCHMPSEFVGIPAVVDDLISAVILFHQRIHFALRNRIHIFHHIIDTVMVNLPAELDLRFHLVAFGDRYIVHVVAETAYTDMRRFDHTQRRSHPAAQLFQYALARPVTDNDLPLDSHAAYDMAVLPVAVG